jgi:AcrR family transcriptional regulator
MGLHYQIDRRAQRKAERREAIIAIAARSFFCYGYSRTTMSAIAEEMGGSKGTLWRYFSSKEELFAAFLDAATASFREAISAALDPRQRQEVVLTEFCEKLIDRITQDDAVALQRLVVSEVEHFPDLLGSSTNARLASAGGSSKNISLARCRGACCEMTIPAMPQKCSLACAPEAIISASFGE